MINISNKKISIPLSEIVIGSVGDNNTEFRVFEMDRYYNDIDLANYTITMEIQPVDKNEVPYCDTLRKSVEGDKIQLFWDIKSYHLKTAGDLKFNIWCGSADEEPETKIWQSYIGTFSVKAGIEAVSNAEAIPPSAYEQVMAILSQRIVEHNADKEAHNNIGTQLESVLSQLDKCVTESDVEEVVTKAVEDIEIVFEEKDPTVPEWAKQPKKPTYTAEEVGALPKDSNLINAEVTPTDDGAIISVTDLNGTTEVTVLNGKDGKDGADGKNGENGKDGADGKDGYTPVKGVDYFDGKDGINGIDGKDGTNGTDGEDGYTPQKGKDYFTEDDIKEIAKQVYIDESNLVHKTELEEIYGFKMFHDGIHTPRISYDGELSLHNSFVELKLTTDYKVVIDDKEVALKEDITPIALREVSTHNADTNSHSDIRAKLDTIEAVAEGAGISETFNNYAEMVSALNEADKSKYKKGRNINIITVGVPDLWVAYVSDAPVAYNYTTDEAFVDELKASGTVQVGYFKLAMLETQKVDLADYAKKEDVTSALGGCIFKQVSQEEYDAMFAEGTLLADVIYIVGGSENAS